MRKVNEVVRTKQVYNLSIEEFKKGEWLSTLPSSDKLEIEYKGNYLVIKDMKSVKEE